MHPLVGRDEELAAIVERFETAERSHAIVLHGDAGIGKTALWSAGIDAAVARGFRVLSARPSEAETGLAFAGVGDLLSREADEVLPELPPVQRRALEAALLLGDGDAGIDDRAVAAAFHAALRTLAGVRPVCLAVDDVQWLDASSLACLRFALARLGDTKLVTLVAARGAPPAWLRRSLDGDRLHVLAVDGLSLGGTHELLRARLDVFFPRPTVIRIWETSRGNPFFALELGGALGRRGVPLAPGEALPISSDLEDLLQQRLAGLTAGAFETACAVAALAEPETAVVASVGSAFDDALREAIDAGVLEVDGDRLRFTHPLLGSAVANRQTPAGRRSLHARLADAAAPGEARARHLALAAAGPDPEVAAVLEQAAHTAQGRGASAAAAELAEQALHLTPELDGAYACRRLFLAADLHAAGGDTGRARTLLEEARQHAAPGVDGAWALVKLAGVVPGRLEPEALYEEALAQAEGDDVLEATIHLCLSGLQRWGAGVERGAAHADQALRAAKRAGDIGQLAAALTEQACWQLRAGRGLPRDMVEEALALERTLPDWPLDDGPASRIAMELMWIVNLDPARTLIHEIRDARRARDDARGEADALWTLGMVEWRAGNWDDADRYLGESLELRTQLGREPTADIPSTILAAHRGLVEQARAQAELGVERGEAMEIGMETSGNLGVLGFLELSLGDPECALGHLKRAHDIRNVFMREPAQHFELGNYLEALIAVGRLDEADELIAHWDERALVVDRAWALAILARARGLLLAARGDPDGAFAQLDRALALHAGVPDPFEHARTLLALGRTQRRAKRRAAARASLTDALGRFERLGAALWAEQARAELGRIGGRTSASGELTAAEQRIADLVSQGRTNREVADALFLTVHSVETALTRIYRKLGVRSRAELAGRQASRG